MYYLLKQLYKFLLFGIAVIIIGCGGAENIVTPKIIEVNGNEKDTIIPLDISTNVRLIGTINIGQNDEPFTATTLQRSKIILYRKPDSSFAINVDAVIINNSASKTGLIELDTVIIRTGTIPVIGNVVLLNGIISSTDTLASKLLFIAEQQTVSTTTDSASDSSYVFRRTAFDSSAMAYNLVITRTINKKVIKLDTVRIPFFPFVSPFDQDTAGYFTIKVTTITNTTNYSYAPIMIEPIKIGTDAFAPALTAILDKNKKLITARFTFNTNKNQGLLDKFNGQDVRLVIDIQIPTQ